MAREYGRAERIADFLKRELAELIQQELRDPRISLVSVNEVKVSRDLSQAKVYVTFLDKDEEQQARESVEVLNKAAGFLRSRIAAEATMRVTPRLRFYFDVSVSRGQHLSALIDKAVRSDHERRSSNPDSQSAVKADFDQEA